MNIRTATKRLAAIGAATCTAMSVNAATAVITFEGELTDFDVEEGAGLLDQIVLTRLKSETFSGKIMIYDFERFVDFNRTERTTTLLDAELSFEGEDDVGLEMKSKTLGGLEGKRSMVANPEFDASKPVCGIKAHQSGDCDEFNPTIIFSHGVDDDGILGAATLKITQGVPTKFEWSTPREVMATFDRFFEANKLNIRLGEATLEIDAFQFDRVEGEFVYFTAVNPKSSLKVQFED